MRLLVLITILLSFSIRSGLSSEAASRGGSGGRVLEVTRLDDDPADPQPGMLRWALMQKGPRVIKFRVAGTIKLRDLIRIKHGRLTIDGGDAPLMGVCIRGGSLEFKGADDIVIRYIRVRLGDDTTRRKNREAGLKRPEGSGGLDCLNFDHCRNVLVDHVSASWSCDEIFSVVHCQNVTVQWCILSEPLSDPRLHPYGDNHAYCFNASASTLRVEHCLFAHYVMRGPQFEANDMRRADHYTVRMEAADNVMFDYQRSGSRYTMAAEDHKKEAVGKRFEFFFSANFYVRAKGRGQAIEAVAKHGVAGNVKAHLSGNVVACTCSGELPANETLAAVLAEAGCSHHRDSVDQRIVRDVRKLNARDTIKSPFWRGGWPVLRRPTGGEKSIIASLFHRRF